MATYIHEHSYGELGTSSTWAVRRIPWLDFAWLEPSALGDNYRLVLQANSYFRGYLILSVDGCVLGELSEDRECPIYPPEH
jgi:hypothetical protein